MKSDSNARAWGWTRWYPLIWLVFVGYPLAALFAEPRALLEYLYGALLLLGFVAVFIWGFMSTRWVNTENPGAYRHQSLIGMGVSYAIMLLLVPVIGWNGIGMLIYAGSFAGVQRSALPAVASVLVSFLFSGVLVLLGELPLVVAASMTFFTIVAAIGNHVGYREALASLHLRRSRDEVARVAKIAERERIARDLHDLLGHTLSVIVLKSELASRLAERDPARAITEIRDVERIARDSLQQVRSAVRGYRSAGLESELASVRLACEAAGLKLELYLEPLELEWAAEQTLSFVLREAVTNAIRHANAKTLWVSLEHAGSDVRLSVWDDGSGRITDGNGVQGMKERVAAANGTLEVHTEHKGVTATLPLTTNTRASDALGLEGKARA
jgi:two-component system, NarL family, sensor histidine kinase DesK